MGGDYVKIKLLLYMEGKNKDKKKEKILGKLVDKQYIGQYYI